MRYPKSALKIDWFFISSLLSSYGLGFILANRVNKSVSVWVTLAGVVLLLFPYFFNYFVGGLIRQFNIDSFEVSRMRRAANLNIILEFLFPAFWQQERFISC